MADDYTIFIGTAGNGLQISQDRGESWTATPHDDTPGVIAAASIFGYLYLGEDGGETWTKPRREFGHVRVVAVTPS